MSEERKIRNDILAIALLAVIIFLVASVATYDPADPAFSASPLLNHLYQPDQLYFPPSTEFNNACGRIGAWTSDMLINTLGVGAYFLIIGLISMEIGLFKRDPIEGPWVKTGGWVLSLGAMTTLASFLLPGQLFSQLIGPGGYLGALGKGILASQLGITGSMIFALTMLVAGMMMWTEYMVFRAGRFMFAPAFMGATRVLPFGIVHRFASWFNGESVVEDEYDDIESEYAEDEDVEDDLPRTIRFRRRDLEVESSEVDEVETGDDEVEDEVFEEEVAAEQE